jgi:hypothetical protein
MFQRPRQGPRPTRLEQVLRAGQAHRIKGFTTSAFPLNGDDEPEWLRAASSSLANANPNEPKPEWFRQMEQDIRNKSDAFRAAREERAECEEELESAKAQLERLEYNRDALTNENAARLARQEGELRDCAENISQCRREADDLRVQMANARSSTSAVTAQLNALRNQSREEIEALKQKLEDCKTEQDVLKEDLNECRFQVEISNDGFSAARKEAGEEKEKNAVLRGEQAQQIAQMENMRYHHEREVQALQAELAAAQDELAAMRRLVAAAESNAQWMFKGVWGDGDGQESPGSSSDTVSPHDYKYKKGDEVWYENPRTGERQRATITLVHPPEKTGELGGSWAVLDYEIRLPDGTFKETTYRQLRPV